MSLISCTIIIAAESLEAANKLAYVIGGPYDTGYAQTFTDRFAYSDNEKGTVTHYGTQAMIDPDDVAALSGKRDDDVKSRLDAVASRQKLELATTKDRSDLFAGIQVFPGGDLSSVVESLGLKRVTETLVIDGGRLAPIEARQ